MPTVMADQRRIPCRACGLPVLPAASFCFVCKAPHPGLLGDERASGSASPVRVARGWLVGLLRSVGRLLSPR